MTSDLYSFNDIIMASWENLLGKIFIRTDNNETLGTICAKYDNTCTLSAMLTNGRLEFLSVNRNNIKRIFGEELDVNAKLFISENI